MRQRRLGTMGATLLATGLLLAACGGGASKASVSKGTTTTAPATGTAHSTATSGPTLTVPATTATTTAPVTTVPPTTTTTLTPLAAMNASAAGYLNARENSGSYYQATPYSWLMQAMPFLTPQFYATLVPPPGPPKGSCGCVSIPT